MCHGKGNRSVCAVPQVYLIIKDVCPGEDEVIIITSSLMKDMNSKTDLYRSNAIRVLCSICGQDTQLLVQIERYLKQAIVDKVSPDIGSCHTSNANTLHVARQHLFHHLSASC